MTTLSMISERQIAIELGVSIATVAVWRKKGYLSDFMFVQENQLKNSYFYDKGEIIDWFANYIRNKKKGPGKPLKNSESITA